jgi:hypothetical protein
VTSGLRRWTKKSGFERHRAAPAPLIFDKALARRRGQERRPHLHRADFNEYPNYWLSDKNSRRRQVTDADPISQGIRVGHKVLIEYRTASSACRAR